MPVCDHNRTISINGIEFTPIEGLRYRTDYIAAYDLTVENKNVPMYEISMWRNLILTDLFFIIYFVMGVEVANKDFVVNACREVEEDEEGMTLDVWAREHFKSTIITIAETLQYQLKNPEKCTAIFAYVRPVAKAFLRSIKNLCETSDLLKVCFPDVIYENPFSQAPKWSEDDGLIFKRKSASRKESSIEAWGLIEGMPTSRHFERRIYDDIETDDIAQNPEQLNKCFSKFEMSDNLGMEGGFERVIGTFYSHNGPIARIQNKLDLDGKPMYKTRIKAATDDGTPSGKPVLLSQERIDKLKMSAHFNSQQLCDPTPQGDRLLSGELLRDIDPEDIPDTHKLMIIDPAGDDKDGSGDSWGIMVVGVEPDFDDIGASNLYILDLTLSPLKEAEGIEEAVRMYLRNGIILQVGVEKVALSSTEIHLANALKVHHRRISVEDKTLFILRPAGRKKNKRIEMALSWPLINGKIHISTAIRKDYRDKLRTEMDEFPFSLHDDGVDVLSYAYDMIHDKDNKYRLLEQIRYHKNLSPSRERHLHSVKDEGWLAA